MRDFKFVFIFKPKYEMRDFFHPIRLSAFLHNHEESVDFCQVLYLYNTEPIILLLHGTSGGEKTAYNK